MKCLYNVENFSRGKLPFLEDKHGWFNFCLGSALIMSMKIAKTVELSTLCSYKLFPWSDRSTFRFVISWHNIQKVLFYTLMPECLEWRIQVLQNASNMVHRCLKPGCWRPKNENIVDGSLILVKKIRAFHIK